MPLVNNPSLKANAQSDMTAFRAQSKIRKKLETSLKPKAATAPAVVHRANIQAKATAPSAPGLSTAAEFATKEVRMSRDEFSKLSAREKSRFSLEGGQIV
jgi:hypothetical protein